MPAVTPLLERVAALPLYTGLTRRNAQDQKTSPRDHEGHQIEFRIWRENEGTPCRVNRMTRCDSRTIRPCTSGVSSISRSSSICCRPAVCISPAQTSSMTTPLQSRPGPFGRHVPVRLQELVFEVVLSPASPHWLAGTLAGAIKRFGYDIPIRKSTLNQLAYMPQGT